MADVVPELGVCTDTQGCFYVSRESFWSVQEQSRRKEQKQTGTLNAVLASCTSIATTLEPADGSCLQALNGQEG